MLTILRLLRVHQWVKNLLIFFPLFFALKFTDTGLLVRACAAFIFFSLTASAVYVVNDLRDVAEDREHPDKRRRPLASGAISHIAAVFIAATLLLAGLGGASFYNKQLFLILAIYCVLNVLYSMLFKRIALLDIFVIATGFLLRLIAGTEYAGLAGVHPSQWIIVMTFLLALFLALAKRRDDVLLAGEGKKTRHAVHGYNLEFINSALAVMTAVIILAYILYTMDPAVARHFGSDKIYLTVIFVILGLFRYLQLTLVYKKSSQPTDLLLRDRFLQLTILGWIALFVILVYLR
ncbi:MAG TPA: decaprenyl-phosphate phosphoribosyltransferase [bacterium]|nr:decaprenyl-phosphate phosphoribosyltransferase [bacterium]